MDKRVLLVAVRGWTTSGEWLLRGRPGGELRSDFIDTLAEKLPATTVWAPELDLAMFSMASAEALSQQLYQQISTKISEMPTIEKVVLLGYSTGSLLARRVFCLAHGAAQDGTLSLPPAAWADKIDRLVVLSGITRGWEFSSAAPAFVRFVGPLLPRLAKIVGWWKRKMPTADSDVPLIWQMKRGAPFVSSTRIQYIHVFQALRKRLRTNSAAVLRANGLPSTIFLLGAKDEYISPADCTELGPRDEFVFVELPGSNHSEAVQIAGCTPEASERRRRLVAAIENDFSSLRKESWTIPAGDIDDYLDPMDIAEARAATEGEKVQHAVIVVHGIRDHGFWTKRVARELKTLGRRSNIVVRAPTPTYGYFSMWDFVRPAGREEAAFWFMERYADVRSHFPDAKISFVGHSNGTYIAARALELSSAIRFHNIVFAGSVVRRGFRWARFAGRVHSVLNYVGTRDSVVAFLPAVFEILNMRSLDVGGAGAFGFAEAKPAATTAKLLSRTSDNQITLSEVRYVRGGHGAAIAEPFWPEIARFVLLDEVPTREAVDREKKFKRMFQYAPVFTFFGVALAVLLLTLPLTVVATIVNVVASTVTPAGVAIAVSVTAVSASLFVSWLTWRFLRMW